MTKLHASFIVGSFVGALVMFAAFVVSLGKGTEIVGSLGTYLCFKTE